jgi:TorA maturation chaperone TorD
VDRTRTTPSDHNIHQIQSQKEPKDQLIAKLQVAHLDDKDAARDTQQRNFLLKRLATCTTLKNPSTTENPIFKLFKTTNTLAKLTSNPSATGNLINVHNLHSSVNVEK